ncbi:protease inhibitor I42 family protein [Legionella spiritensis]|uniref:protease inhibitor I42 family protein n=1 Tax=Legionella spiritensis TaxID=452 RepID=UPI000F719849|nr:protease inhibitor I42 family protein [Legionella spiritensis]VEG89845.1 secreted protein [Legionella spiritensis]
MKILLASFILLMSTVLFAENTMTTDVHPGQKKLTITLPSNPTTGYSWTVKKYDKSLFKLLSSRYLAPKTQLIGAGGNMLFVFKIIKATPQPETSVMEFLYARPWEPDKGTLKTVTIRFQKDTR